MRYAVVRERDAQGPRFDQSVIELRPGEARAGSVRVLDLDFI